jgi:hypothetical protein
MARDRIERFASLMKDLVPLPARTKSLNGILSRLCSHFIITSWIGEREIESLIKTCLSLLCKRYTLYYER